MVHAYIIEEIPGFNGAPARGFRLEVNQINLVPQTADQHMHAIAHELRTYADTLASLYVNNPTAVRGYLQLVNPANYTKRVSSQSIHIQEISFGLLESLLDDIAQSNDDIQFSDVDYEFYFRTTY